MLTYVKMPEPWDPRQPQGRAVILRPEQVRWTIAHLRTCIRARKAGYPVSYTTDPEWLIDMAINRRAGWPDDPTHSRGSCMPVGGRYPRRAEGAAFMLVWRLAHEFMSYPRLVKRESEVRCIPRRIRERITHRVLAYDEY